MINGNIEQFLDTGWYSEANLYYHGNAYWCEAQWNDDGIPHFFVYQYPALNINNDYCLRIIENDGKFQHKIVFDMVASDIDYIKMIFMKAEIFEGKNFWNIETDVAWLDDVGNIIRKDIPEYLDAVRENNYQKMKELSSRYKTIS